jgi:hypothetical protein
VIPCDDRLQRRWTTWTDLTDHAAGPARPRVRASRSRADGLLARRDCAGTSAFAAFVCWRAVPTAQVAFARPRLDLPGSPTSRCTGLSPDRQQPRGRGTRHGIRGPSCFSVTCPLRPSAPDPPLRHRHRRSDHVPPQLHDPDALTDRPPSTLRLPCPRATTRPCPCWTADPRPVVRRAGPPTSRPPRRLCVPRAPLRPACLAARCRAPSRGRLGRPAGRRRRRSSRASEPPRAPPQGRLSPRDFRRLRPPSPDGAHHVRLHHPPSCTTEQRQRPAAARTTGCPRRPCAVSTARSQAATGPARPPRPRLSRRTRPPPRPRSRAGASPLGPRLEAWPCPPGPGRRAVVRAGSRSGCATGRSTARSTPASEHVVDLVCWCEERAWCLGADSARSRRPRHRGGPTLLAGRDPIADQDPFSDDTTPTRSPRCACTRCSPTRGARPRRRAHRRALLDRARRPPGRARVAQRLQSRAPLVLSGGRA